jgi:YbbR domain-containing protein
MRRESYFQVAARQSITLTARSLVLFASSRRTFRLLIMPYRNADRWLRRVARAPQEWLQKIFLDNWYLKLLALAVTLGLWYSVTNLRTPTTVRLSGIHLIFRLPSQMEIGNDPRTEVEAILTGSREALNHLNARDLVAYVDISDYRTGERVIKLSPGRVHMELTNGVRLESLQPDSVVLHLEPAVQRDVAVEPQLQGQLPAGYEMRAISLNPEKVRVRGPASHIYALSNVSTESIPLDDLRTTTTLPQVAVIIADPKITLLDPTISVRLEISEQHAEKSSSNDVNIASHTFLPKKFPFETSLRN